MAVESVAGILVLFAEYGPPALIWPAFFLAAGLAPASPMGAFCVGDFVRRGAPISQRMDVTSVGLWDFVDASHRKIES
jgi:hypothetical protein